MNLTTVIVRFAPAIGALLLGPVSTMIMSPERSEVSYVYGVTDGLLVAFAITFLSNGLLTISSKTDVVG